jgi:hypothetical protein
LGWEWFGWGAGVVYTVFSVKQLTPDL